MSYSSPAAPEIAPRRGGRYTRRLVSARALASQTAFLAALKQQNRRWLQKQIGGRPAGVDVLAQLDEERRREELFAQRSLDRIARDIPKAVALPIYTRTDRRARVEAVQGVLGREMRYAQLRSREMGRRSLAAVNRGRVRQASPDGAFWNIGYAKNHTEGCVHMAGRAWPWVVLDRVHPPRHPGCTSSLHTLDDAIARGWMKPGDLPSKGDAIALASGVMMEGEADRLLAELEVRERLLELGADPVTLEGLPWSGVLLEAFESARHPRDFRGRFRGLAIAAALRAGRDAEIEPQDAPGLVDALHGGAPAALHRLQVRGSSNLFRTHARELTRAEMPQVPKADLPGFMDFLRSKRVAASIEEVAPRSLQATQNQVDGASVAKLAKGWDPARAGTMLISRDSHVLDGHHRWAAAALFELTNPGYKIQAMRFSVGTDRMLALMREYNAQIGRGAREFGAGVGVQAA